MNLEERRRTVQVGLHSLRLAEDTHSSVPTSKPFFLPSPFPHPIHHHFLWLCCVIPRFTLQTSTFLASSNPIFDTYKNCHICRILLHYSRSVYPSPFWIPPSYRISSNPYMHIGSLLHYCAQGLQSLRNSNLTKPALGCKSRPNSDITQSVRCRS